MKNLFKNIFAKTSKTETIQKPDLDESGIVIVYGDSLFSGENPDAKLADYEKMIDDEQVSVCLDVRLMAMLAKGYVIKAPEGKEELGKEIEANLNNLAITESIGGSFLRSLKEIELTKKVSGFSLSEIVWEMLNGKLYVSKIKTLNSQKIKFYPDVYGNLLEDGIRQDTGNGIINLPVEKFILHINNFRGGNYFGTSELKPSYKPYKRKEKLQTLYDMLLERFGIPPILMTYNPNDAAFLNKTTAQAKEILQEIARTARKTHQGGVIMIPQTYEHEIIQLNPQSAKAFENALDRCDFSITKGLKVPSELGFLNVKVGSNAKADTQFDFFLMIVDQDKIDLEETINEQLIKRYCLYNYGEMDEYPTIKFNPTTADDVYEIIKAYNEALKSGAVRPTKEGEKKTLDMLGYPEINEDEIIGTKPQPDNNLPNPDPNKPADKPNKKKVFSKTEYNGVELSNAEQKVNFSKIDNFFTDKEEKAQAEFSDIAYKIFVDISNKIINKKIITEKKLDEIEKLTIQGSLIGDIKKLLQSTFGQAYKEGKASIIDELNINKNFAISASELPEPEYYMWIKTLSKEIAGELAGAYLTETKKVLLMGIQSGYSEKKIVQQLEEAFSLAQKAGSIQTPAITENRLGTIVRTNLNAAFNKARYNEVIQINNDSKDTYYKVFSEILDGRNHPFSLFIHGKAVKVGTDLDQMLQYPMHYNDRGLAVYVNAQVEGEPPNVLEQMPPLQGYSGLLIK